MTNQVKYDRNKDRQGLFDKDFFEQSYENNLMLLNVTFQCEKDYPTEPPTNVVDQVISFITYRIHRRISDRRNQEAYESNSLLL